MMRNKTLWGLIFSSSILLPILLLRLFNHYDAAQLQVWLQQWGILAPGLYVVLYVVATILILPSTALNLTAGAFFGPWVGTVWASCGAVVAAIATFGFTRIWGRRWVSQHLATSWQTMDQEIQRGGVTYIFALRLLPIIPYGLVNFTAGLTSIRFRDYLIGTLLGTVPGILPFVMLGSYGFKALSSGEWLPVALSLSLAALLVAGSTWYRHRAKLKK